jgi:DNA primase
VPHDGLSTRAEPDRDRERVRDASPIERVIGEHLQLKPAGREYRCLCPFHDDHRPSMHVVPHKQIFHCFVCGAGGDVFTFVQKFHTMEFREALEYLAERAGVELARCAPDGRSGPGGEGVSRADLFRAGAFADSYFKALYRHEQHGAAARGAVQARGIAPAMVDAFGIGASADRWDGLVLTAQKQGVAMDALAEAGLVKARDSGGFYDAFRHRVMFPIQDRAGRVVAFGARKIRDEDEPKYLNSPETRLFNKSGTLYGLFQAQRSIQAEKLAVVTEGYTDTIACHQAGLTNVVATLGTALTREHAAELRRVCDTVVLLFDGDQAGLRAADRATSVFFTEEVDVRIALLDRFTDAKDPDELLKRPGVDGVAVLRRAIEQSEDLLAFRFARLRRSLAGAGLSALARAVNEELANLAGLGLADVPPLRRRLVIKQIAVLTGVDEGTVSAAVPAGRAARGPAPSRPEPPAPAPLDQALSRAELLVGCVLNEGSLWAGLSDEQRDLILRGEYRSELYRAVSREVARAADAGESPGLAGVLSRVQTDDAAGAATGLAQRVEALTGADRKRLTELWSDCLARVSSDAASERVEPGEASVADLIARRRAGGGEAGRDNRRFPRPRV